VRACAGSVPPLRLPPVLLLPVLSQRSCCCCSRRAAHPSAWLPLFPMPRPALPAGSSLLCTHTDEEVRELCSDFPNTQGLDFFAHNNTPQHMRHLIRSGYIQVSRLGGTRHTHLWGHTCLPVTCPAQSSPACCIRCVRCACCSRCAVPAGPRVLPGPPAPPAGRPHLPGRLPAQR